MKINATDRVCISYRLANYLYGMIAMRFEALSHVRNDVNVNELRERMQELGLCISLLEDSNRKSELFVRKIKPSHAVADAFWKYWSENGELHKHGYYESTWGAINAALAAEVLDDDPVSALIAERNGYA